MYRIVVCDDEDNIRERLKAYLQCIAIEENIEYELLEFSSADDLLNNYPADIDLLLLDIYMEGTDGMDAAKKIRTFDTEVCIIFITTMYQRAIDGYAVRAFGFIRKPVSYAEIKHEFKCAIKQMDRRKEQEQYIAIHIAGSIQQLPLSHISYCEVRNHNVLICMNGKVTTYRYSMKELMKQLIPYGFLRCHSSYLVNIRHIRSVESAQVVLKDGTSVPISQRRKKEFLAAFTDYIGEQI